MPQTLTRWRPDLDLPRSHRYIKPEQKQIKKQWPHVNHIQATSAQYMTQIRLALRHSTGVHISFVSAHEWRHQPPAAIVVAGALVWAEAKFLPKMHLISSRRRHSTTWIRRRFPTGESERWTRLVWLKCGRKWRVIQILSRIDHPHVRPRKWSIETGAKNSLKPEGYLFRRSSIMNDDPICPIKGRAARICAFLFRDDEIQVLAGTKVEGHSYGLPNSNTKRF